MTSPCQFGEEHHDIVVPILKKGNKVVVECQYCNKIMEWELKEKKNEERRK